MDVMLRLPDPLLVSCRFLTLLACHVGREVVALLRWFCLRISACVRFHPLLRHGLWLRLLGRGTVVCRGWLAAMYAAVVAQLVAALLATLVLMVVLGLRPLALLGLRRCWLR